jgi:hypothetical protein
MKWLCCNCHVDDEEDGHDMEQAKTQSNKIDRTLLAFNACLVNSGMIGPVEGYIGTDLLFSLGASWEFGNFSIIQSEE